MTQITANGITLEYDEIGDPNHPPLLLVMGLGGQMVRWTDGFREAFVEKGFRVVRFDNRDVGLSHKFEGMKTPGFGEIQKNTAAGKKSDVPYTLDDMAADAVGLLDALEISSAHILGVSMGGMIVQLMAADYGSRVRSVTSIMSTTGNPKLRPATPEAMAVLTSAPENPDDIESIIQHNMKTHKVIGSPGYPYPDELLYDVNARAIKRAYYPQGFNRQYAAILASGSRVEKLKKVTCPALVIHGSADPLVPVDGGEDTARSIPHAELEIIDGMGHDIPPGLIERITGRVAEFAHRAEKQVAAAE